MARAVLNPLNSDILGNVIDRLASRVSDAFKHLLKVRVCLRCNLTALLEFFFALLEQGVVRGEQRTQEEVAPHSNL